MHTDFYKLVFYLCFDKMENLLYYRTTLISILFITLLTNLCLAFSLSANPNTITLTNSTIDLGQISVANTVISNGSQHYSGEWTWFSSNQIGSELSSTISLGTYPQGIAFSPSGAFAYAANYGGNTISVINTATNTVVDTVPVGIEPEYVAFNPSGTLAYVTNQGSGTVSVLSTATNSVIFTLTAGTYLNGVAFNPSGTLAYVTNYDGAGAVNVIDTSTNSIIATIPVGSSPDGIALNPSGTLAYVTNNSGNTITVINTATNTVVNTILVGTRPLGVAFNPSGTLAYVTNQASGTVSVINTVENLTLTTINVGLNPISIALNPSGTLAYVSDYSASNVVVIDTATNTIIQTIPLGTTPYDIAINPKGNTIYVTNDGQPGAGTANIIQNIPETTMQALPTIETNNGLLQLTVNAISTNKVIFTFNGIMYNVSTGSNTIYGNWNIYGFATDGSNTILLSKVLTINPALIPGSPLSSFFTFDKGQSITITSNSSGGTPPYSYQWRAGTSSTCSSDNIVSGAVSSTYTFSPSSNTFYCYTTTDSATTPTDMLSSTVNIIINPAFSSLTMSPSNPSFNGSPITFNLTWSGGTPTFGASLYSSNSVNCNQSSTLIQQIIGISSHSVQFDYVLPKAKTYYCAFVTDNALNPSITGAITTGLNVPFGIAIPREGKYAYIVNKGNGTLAIADLATNTVVHTISGGFLDPHYVAIAPSGTYAYVTNFNGNNALIINTTTNASVGTVVSGLDGPEGVAFSPSGNYAYISNYRSNNVVIINTATNTVTGSVSGSFNSPFGIAFSPDGSHAYIINNGGTEGILIVNTSTNTVVNSIPYSTGGLQGIGIAPSGTYLYVPTYPTSNGENADLVINTATNTVVGSLNSGFSTPLGVSFSPDGSIAYIANGPASNVVILNTGVTTLSAYSTAQPYTPSQTTTSPAPLPSTSFYLNDNINKSINSSSAVIKLSYIKNGRVISSDSYYQSQLPISTILYGEGYLNFTFSCFFDSYNAMFKYNGILYGGGIGIPCNTNYTSFGGNYTIIYSQHNLPAQPQPSKCSYTKTNLSSASNTLIFGIDKCSIITLSLNSSTIQLTSGNNASKTNISVSRIRLPEPLPQNLGNYIILSLFNISSPIPLNLSIPYMCSLNATRITPFFYINNTFEMATAFTINATSCSISLQIPGDPIVGLFYNASTVSTSSTTPSTTSSNNTATSVETTIPVNSIAPQTTTKQNTSQQGSYTDIALLIIFICIIIAAYWWYATVKKRIK